MGEVERGCCCERSVSSDPEMFWNCKPNVPRPVSLYHLRVPSTFITTFIASCQSLSPPQVILGAQSGRGIEYIQEPMLCYFYTPSPLYVLCFWKLMWVPQTPHRCFRGRRRTRSCAPGSASGAAPRAESCPPSKRRSRSSRRRSNRSLRARKSRRSCSRSWRRTSARSCGSPPA